MHSPPSQLLPIRGNPLAVVRSSQILHSLLRREAEADADHVAEAYADADEENPLFQCKPPQPNPIMHLPFGGRGRWQVGDGCR